MEKRLNAILLLLLSVLLSFGAGCANPGGLAIAGKTGTLGLGGELTAGIAPDINTRVGLNTLDLDFDWNISDIEYDLGLDFFSFSALVDLYIIDDFHLTSGVVFFDHKLNMRSRPTISEEIGGVVYSAADIGTLYGSVEVEDVAPYIGIGWGNALNGGRWGFYCDLGVAFINSPDVDLSANGLMASNSTFQANLARERDEIEDDLEFFKYYPVISIGLFFRF
ncbi:MAG: hypothetical protein CEE38_04240 [Planctomycetes bacterium B3_Pla]|nr:MAG: hypothetical protein CEE38_04240 [Planctomycetes bacterium B3_Pla]